MNPRFLIHAALTLLAVPALLRAVPTEIARESFEGVGGTIGFTTSIAQFDEPTVATSDFFSVQPNDGTKLINATVIAGDDGANMFAAEDIDTTPTNHPPTQFITFNPVNITGKTLTSVKILLSAPGTGPAAGGTNQYDWSATSADINLIRVEASVDGGPFNRLAQFSPHTATLNQPLSLDTNGDGLGGEGTILTAAFQDFDFPFPTGGSVQIRVVMHSNASSEYLCIDNVRIFGDNPVTAPPALGGVPGTPLVFPEGGPPAALAPAITVSDTDSANLASATVTITANLTSGEDVLAATPSGAILAGDIVYNPGTGTLTITRSAPLATYQTVLRSVTYQNTNVAGPNTALRSITFSASDGVNASNSPIRQVDVVDTILTHNLPFTESFETDGRGTRYALDGRFTNGAAMFDRGQPSGTTNLDGTFAVIAEDTLLDPAPVKAARFHLNTQPFGGVNASVRLGALGGAIYDTGDVIAIEASVNGGAYNTVAAFRSMGGVGFPMALDTDNNGIGDGTQLSATMQDFSFPMPAAATLGLRIRCQSNTTAERLIVDRIVVTGTPVTFSINSVSGGESGTRSFTVTRNTASGPDTVDFIAGGGSATSGTDYTAASGTVSFADTETTKPIVVTITADNIVELDETFQVTLSNPSRGTVTGGPGTGTITNDDSAVLTLTGGTATEGDTGTTPITYSLVLSNPVDVAVTFNRATQVTGTATSGTDFTAVPSTATSISALTTTGSFTVNAIGDHDPESTETVPVQLSTLAAGGRNVTFSGGGATLTVSGGIIDDDPPIVPGTGSIGTGVGASGKLTVASLLALASGGEGPLSLVSVQAGPTAGGGTVTVTDGWINYQPAPGFSGADSFSYTITDGFNSANGTVNVVASNGIGQTVNIVSITPQGGGNLLVALGIPGRTYQWQTSPNLTTWTNLGAPIVCPNSGVVSQTDPGPLPPTRFYRMVQP